MEPEREDKARGRRALATLGLWRKDSFPGWEDARGRNAMASFLLEGSSPFSTVVVPFRVTGPAIFEMKTSLSFGPLNEVGERLDCFVSTQGNVATQ